MQVNDSPGKTEAMFHDHGQDSLLATQVQAASFAQPNNHQVLRAQGKTFKPLAVSVVTRYKHLGALNEGHGRYEVEMAVRATQSLQAEKPLRKKVFANRGIPHRKRQTTWTAFSCSKLLFHASTWARMSSASWKAIDSKYHSGLRMVLARPKAQGTRTNLGVRADAKALPLDDLVATRRLGLVKRALDHAPPWFIGLLQATDRAPRSWTKLIRADLN